MGKTGKWIRNLLMGKKEDKYKKIDAVCTESRSAVMDSPKVKRRWSFGRLTGGRTTGRVVAGQKFSMSFNSVDTAKLEIQTLLKTRAPRSLPTAPEEASEETKNSAATKIQAAFRSYLARRALHALKGLVKLQALVRGHLVRKQTTATLRGMHALMAIQVRARIHRIQMVEEATILGKQPIQHTEIPHGKGLIREDKDSKDMSVEEMLKALKKRSGFLDLSHVRSMKHDSMTFYSKRKSVSEREYGYIDYNLITAPNSPENYWALSEFDPTTMALSTSQLQPVSNRRPWSPNYMNNTESSKAKARSQSEPKQRPKRGMKHKGKSEESTKELITSQNGPRQNLYSNSSCVDHGSLDHWVINLYGSTKEGRHNSFSSSTVTSDSYH